MTPTAIAIVGFGVIAGSMAGFAARAMRSWAVPVPEFEFPAMDAPEPILRGALDVTTAEDRAHRSTRLRDRRGREWVVPEGYAPCGVCEAVGGHLPQCPAADGG